MNYPNVAIAVPVFPNIVQTYIINQLTAFKAMGVNFSIIAQKRGIYEQLPPLINEYHLLDDATYISTEPSEIPRALFTLPLLNPHYRHALKKILSFNGLDKYDYHYRLKALIRCRALAFKDFDIFHSHSMFSSFNYLFMKEVLSIPMITTYHGHVPRGVNKLDDRKFKLVLDKGDAFIVNTSFARNELAQLGCQPDKIHMIPQGTNLDQFPFKERKINLKDKIILLTVGRLSIEKGHHIAIEALAALADQFPTLEYHIVGDGPAKKELVHLCRQLNLMGKVKFHGFQTGDELLRNFANAHIFVLPSIDTKDGYAVETQGVVLQEAQACGIPVIGSHTGGIPDVINHGITGLLYNESDPLELARTYSTTYYRSNLL